MNKEKLWSQEKPCVVCGKLKPYCDFITGTDAYLRVTYSQICEACRKKEESAGKKARKLSITHEDKALAIKNKLDEKQKMETEKRNYFSKQKSKK